MMTRELSSSPLLYGFRSPRASPRSPPDALQRQLGLLTRAKPSPTVSVPRKNRPNSAAPLLVRDWPRRVTRKLLGQLTLSAGECQRFRGPEQQQQSSPPLLSPIRGRPAEKASGATAISRGLTTSLRAATLWPSLALSPSSSGPFRSSPPRPPFFYLLLVAMRVWSGVPNRSNYLNASIGFSAGFYSKTQT
ncbi:hypothetical protein VUR80DRAFT_1981 [Thermomyces stellatus]